MYIRESKKTVRGKTYVNHVLVESVLTPKGPRQKAVCSLGTWVRSRAAEFRIVVRKVLAEETSV